MVHLPGDLPLKHLNGILGRMQPDFEQLLQIIRVAAQQSELDFMRVVLATKGGGVWFVEVVDGPDFRSQMELACRKGYQPLGLLAWELDGKMIQAKSFLFPWHEDDETLCALFKRLCEDGVDCVKE